MSSPAYNNYNFIDNPRPHEEKKQNMADVLLSSSSSSAAAAPAAPRRPTTTSEEDPSTIKSLIDEILLGCLTRAVVNKRRCEFWGASIQHSSLSDPSLKEAVLVLPPLPATSRTTTRTSTTQDEGAGTTRTPPPLSSQETAAAAEEKNGFGDSTSLEMKSINNEEGRLEKHQPRQEQGDAAGQRNSQLGSISTSMMSYPSREPDNRAALEAPDVDPHVRLLGRPEEELQSRGVTQRRRKARRRDLNDETKSWRSPFSDKNFKRVLMEATAELCIRQETLLEDVGYFFLDYMR